jgi:hypothetical protein
MDRTVKLWDTPRLAQVRASPTSQGNGGGEGSGVRAACKIESEKLCAGEERLGRCLRARMDQLSADCKAALGSSGRNQ